MPVYSQLYWNDQTGQGSYKNLDALGTSRFNRDNWKHMRDECTPYMDV